jgi:predicted porin
MMKKSLIALALVAAAPVAFAATSNVDVYGQMRLSADFTDGEKSKLVSQASRVGIKGSEDLGGGLSAIWGAEWGVDVADNTASSVTVGGPKTTTASSPFSARNTFVGVKGSFGTVLAGNHDTPYKLAGSADLFGDTAADSQDSKVGIIGRNGMDLRAAQAVAYITPDYNGFHAAVAMTNTGAAENLDYAKSVALVYVNGPLSVKYGFEDQVAQEGNKLTVSYKMGDLSVAGTYEKQETTAGLERTASLVSAAYGMGPITLAAQIGNAETTATAGSATTELDRTTVGVIYALSKRTNMALAYNIDSATATADVKTTTLQLNHSF